MQVSRLFTSTVSRIPQRKKDGLLTASAQPMLVQMQGVCGNHGRARDDGLPAGEAEKVRILKAAAGQTPGGIALYAAECRGEDSLSRPRSGKSIANSIGSTVLGAMLPDVSLRGAKRRGNLAQASAPPPCVARRGVLRNLPPSFFDFPFAARFIIRYIITDSAPAHGESG